MERADEEPQKLPRASGPWPGGGGVGWAEGRSEGQAAGDSYSRSAERLRDKKPPGACRDLREGQVGSKCLDHSSAGMTRRTTGKESARRSGGGAGG